MANKFHPSARISQLASIEISTRGTDTIIGENSVIDDFVKIKHVGGKGNVEIGNSVYINSCTVIYSGNGVKIGNAVSIGPNCNITPVNHAYENKNKLIQEQGFALSKGGIIIEDDVWIGSNVTIHDGAVIRKGAVIGSNSLVVGVVEEYSVNMGNPVKCMGYRK